MASMTPATPLSTASTATKVELVDGGVIPGATRIVDEAYNYTDADQIGEGTYGKVYKGTDKAGDKVALKMIRMDNEKEGFPITAIREIKLLSTLKHPNIVNLREIVRSRVNRESKYKGDIFMVFDYAEHDLTGMMDAVKHKGLSIPQVKCIMMQLLKGLAHCHLNGILHRDLKASNLLIDRHGNLKIADFGLARNYSSTDSGKLTNRVITLWYRPPELLLGAEKYGPEVDVWSVGCIFAELLARKPLFPGNNEQQQLDCIFKMMGAPSEENWPGVSKLEFFSNVKTSAYNRGPQAFDDWCSKYRVPQDAVPLLRDMLSLDPAKRISALDAALHDYFHADPAACSPEQLPKLPDCHEWTTKKRKQQQQQQHQQQQHSQHHHGHHAQQQLQQQQQQQQHPQHYMQAGGHRGGAPQHYGMGGAPPPQHVYPQAGGPPITAAGGYDGRSVRPRVSGGGGPPPPGGVPGHYGHAPPGGLPPVRPPGGGFQPGGPPAGAGGFQPGMRPPPGMGGGPVYGAAAPPMPGAYAPPPGMPMRPGYGPPPGAQQRGGMPPGHYGHPPQRR